MIVASAFFAILWQKNYVLYPPGEFGENIDVTKFVQAMQKPAGIDDSFVNRIENTIRASISSPSVVQDILATISSRLQSDFDRTGLVGVLEDAAGNAANQVIKENSIAIEYTKISSDLQNDHAPMFLMRTVQDLLNYIWITRLTYIGVPPYTYGRRWVRWRSRGAESVSGSTRSPSLLVRRLDTARVVL